MTPRKIKCRTCKQPFARQNSLQVVCSMACAIEYSKATRAKIEAKEYRAKREAMKTRQTWLREAQAVVNAYVRARDARLPCVSCDMPAAWDGQWHASHFRSVKAASAIRFNLWNIHKSCSVCNNWKSGNLSEYEPKLREKIGDEKVDWLRTQSHARAYDIEYLKRIKKIFTKKLKTIQCRMR